MIVVAALWRKRRGTRCTLRRRLCYHAVMPSKRPTSSQTAFVPQFELLRITGDHAVSFLGRMLSNALPTPDEDRAAPAFLLAPTGRIVGGAAFAHEGDHLLAVCPGGWATALTEGLLHYRVADRVDIQSDARPVTYVANPPPTLLPAAPWGLLRHQAGLALRWPWTGLDELLWIGDGAPHSASPEPVPIEVERIAAGTPAFGHELDSDTIPIEAALTDWLSADKGCYVGQEVIERMWSRERTARRLVAWRRKEGGPLPELPAALTDGPHAGALTSAAVHPEFGVIGLGWLPTRAATTARFLDTHGGHWLPLDHPPATGRVLPTRQLREGT